MKFRLHHYPLMLVAIAGFGLPADSAAADELELNASTPEVTISTRPAGRNFIRLPSLSYRFSVEARCTAGRRAQAISISVADTRVSVPTGNLPSDGRVDIEMTVPADVRRNLYRALGAAGLGRCLMMAARHTGPA